MEQILGIIMSALTFEDAPREILAHIAVFPSSSALKQCAQCEIFEILWQQSLSPRSMTDTAVSFRFYATIAIF